MKSASILLMVFTIAAFGQSTASKSLLGTVSAVRQNSAEIEVKPDNGALVTVKTTAATVAQRVAPGQTDLTKAESIKTTDVAAGDRVLITLGVDAGEARRIVVIAATDLAKRDAADSADWQKRGVAGVVTAVSGFDISLESQSLGAKSKFIVTVGPKSSIKRYAADSVRYADAKDSIVSEIKIGDKLRARGQKSDDGLKVAAEDIVFGTFLSRAGTITALNAANHELTIKDLASNKPLVIQFTSDSTVKRMPAQSAGSTGGRGANSSDIGQLLESLPPIRFEDLKNGEIVVLAAVQGSRPDQIRAVTLLANAEALVQLAMAARGVGATGPAPSLAGLASAVGP